MRINSVNAYFCDVEFSWDNCLEMHIVMIRVDILLPKISHNFNQVVIVIEFNRK